VSAVTTFIDAFAEEVGASGPIAVEGGRTRWQVGGTLDADARVLRAPVGIVDYQPEEMTVRVGAGTSVGDLHVVLAEHRQSTALPDRPGGTVGGALMVGESSLHRLGRGHVRDALLQAVYVGAEGQTVKAGGPTVKNVSGFDLCRALVGSLGTLGLVAEVILRTQPIPAASEWRCADGVEPWSLPTRLLTASAVLFDGTTTWVHLEGHPGDVVSDAASIEGEGFVPTDGPSELPVHRWSLTPAGLADLDATEGAYVAEVGVGTAHRTQAQPTRSLDPMALELNRRIKAQFDPSGRLNPGRLAF
jgi:glycolate oxidase FAD binding subunit